MKIVAFLKPAFNFLLIGLLITTSSRFVLFVIFSERVTQTTDFGYLFPIGLRMDLILMSYLLFLPVLLLVFLPSAALRKFSPYLNGYFILCLGVLLLLELSTPNFVRQYDTRPNKLFIDYLLAMPLKSNLWSLIIAIVVLSAFTFALIHFRKRLFLIQYGAYRTKLILSPLILFLLFFGARSSLTSKRPVDASDAVFSGNHLTDSLALNSFYTITVDVNTTKNGN